MLDYFNYKLKKQIMKEPIYLGIDVSKGYSDFVLMNSSQELLEGLFQLDDTFKGHEQLKALLKKYVSKMPGIEIFCGLESTGGYERNWYNYLLQISKELPLKVALINPVLIKGVSKSLLTRTITDSVSAINIGIYLMNYKSKIKFNNEVSGNENPFKEGRSLYTYQKMLNKQKVQLNNQLEKLLYQNFSEILIYCRNGIPVWLLRLLVKYPTPESIKKAGIEKIKKIQGIGNDKAGKIIQKAEINTQRVDMKMAFIIKNTSSEILHKEEKLYESKSFLESIYKENPTVKLLCSICGIAYSSAIAILFEIEDINRFDSAKKIAAYFGLNPQFKQSGDGSWGNHLSKKGRKLMRTILYMTCLCAIRHDPMMKKKYADIRAKGRCHLFAMGVLMHKMLRIIYGILKTEKPYDTNIDEKNKQKSIEKQTDLDELKKNQIRENLKKIRRYQKQNIDEMPISKRRVKKIKELEMPQEVLQLINTGSNPVQ